mgnify:CR=1 FL=1
MLIFRHWLAALLVFYWCLMSPVAFACEAMLKYTAVPGFVDRGVLGSKDTYTQRVYSGDQMSYSTVTFSPDTRFNKTSIIEQTARSIIKTVSASSKTSDIQVKNLNKVLLPQIDDRLAFLSYVDYAAEGSITVEASSAIRTDTCWSVLRFSALKKQTKEDALNFFANLIRATQFIE